MTDESKERKCSRQLAWYYRNREKCRAYKRAYDATPQRKEYLKKTAGRRKEYQHKYYERNKAKISARSCEYRKAHKAEIYAYNHRPDVQEKNREYKRRPEVKARAAETHRQWYEKNRTEILRRQKIRRQEPDMRVYRQIQDNAKNAAKDERCREDASYYAAVRAYDRKRKARKCIAEGRSYKARMNSRIPDCLKKGEDIKMIAQTGIWYKDMCQIGLRIK